MRESSSVGAEREQLFGRLSLLRSKIGPECQALMISRDLVDGLLAWSRRLADDGVQLDPLAPAEPQTPEPEIHAATMQAHERIY